MSRKLCMQKAKSACSIFYWFCRMLVGRMEWEEYCEIVEFRIGMTLRLLTGFVLLIFC